MTAPAVKIVASVGIALLHLCLGQGWDEAPLPHQLNVVTCASLPGLWDSPLALLLTFPEPVCLSVIVPGWKVSLYCDNVPGFSVWRMERCMCVNIWLLHDKNTVCCLRVIVKSIMPFTFAFFSPHQRDVTPRRWSKRECGPQDEKDSPH